MKLAFVLIALALSLQAPSVTWPQSRQPAAAQAETPAPSQEVELLRTQLSVVRSFQEQLLNTVLWALATIATIAVLLVGYGWFTNFRIYERDKESLARELGTLVEQKTGAARLAMDEYALNGRKDFADFKTAIEKSFSEQLERRLSTSAEEVNKAIMRVEAESRNEKDSLRRDLGRLELDLLQVERENWLKEEVYSNALYCSGQILQKAIEVGGDYQLTKALDCIREDMKLVADKKAELNVGVRTHVIEKLDKVSGPHAQIAVELKKSISTY